MMSARTAALLVVAGLFFLDRLTKVLIRAHVSMWDTHVVIPGFFNIVHTENPGIAFGLFADAGQWRSAFVLVLSVIVMVLVAATLWQPATRDSSGRRLRYGLALMLGGAAGNLYDRIFHGTVTDFLDFHLFGHHWPVFNIADSAITVGAALILADLWLSRGEAPAKR